MSLRECGIRPGSTLTLHALGMSAEKKQQMTEQAFATMKAESENEGTVVLDTPTTAEQADHSYNGIIFDVACNGPYEVDLLSIFIAGMLSRVRIFARVGPWEDEKAEPMPGQIWWAHREKVSQRGWVRVADQFCRPSWDKPVEIKFDIPVKLLPHQRRGLYCHSGLPDDLGIQYQSYPKEACIAQDNMITVLPGLGHTGSEPFDETHGW